MAKCRTCAKYCGVKPVETCQYCVSGVKRSNAWTKNRGAVPVETGQDTALGSPETVSLASSGWKRLRETKRYRTSYEPRTEQSLSAWTIDSGIDPEEGNVENRNIQEQLKRLGLKDFACGYYAVASPDDGEGYDIVAIRNTVDDSVVVVGLDPSGKGEPFERRRYPNTDENVIDVLQREVDATENAAVADYEQRVWADWG